MDITIFFYFSFRFYNIKDSFLINSIFSQIIFLTKEGGERLTARVPFQRYNNISMANINTSLPLNVQVSS